jgi:hypothetical protein
MWMAAQDQPHENYIFRGGTTTWKRFDDLEITTNKTIESTGCMVGWKCSINLSGNF